MTTKTQLNLYQKVEDAIAEAERICAYDSTSPECKVAWDIVEELEAADSHKDGMAPPGGPDLEVLLYSFDILMKKIDGKMDQLKGTLVKLDSVGVEDPSIAELCKWNIEKPLNSDFIVD